MRLRVDPTRGDVELVLPNAAHEEDGRLFVDRHRGWIEQQLAALAPRRPFIDGATVPLLDGEITVAHRPRLQPGATLEGALLVVGGPARALAACVTGWLCEHAGEMLQARTLRHAATLGVGYSLLRIGDMKTRWGSCSSRGTLSFSWRLVMAPERVLDYVAAHEVAHLREANHGKRFWRLVETLDPDWQEARAWLRRHGSDLHRYGGA